MNTTGGNSLLKLAALAVLLLALIDGPGASIARGDGGTLQLARDAGNYRIAVFTSPTPVRVGPLDVSVMVQDRQTGESLPGADVFIRWTPRGEPRGTFEIPATREAATNKLLRAANFDLPNSGWWEVTVRIDGARGEAEARFAISAAEPLARWQQLWPWFSWPAAVVLLFGMQQVLVLRRSR